MALEERSANQGDAKRFIVQCDECSFASEAEGRYEARGMGTTHHRETGHDVVAVEWPDQ